MTIPPDQSTSALHGASRRAVPLIAASALFLAATGGVVAASGAVHGPAHAATATAGARTATTQNIVLAADDATTYDLPSGSTLTVSSSSITLYLSPEAVDEINDLAAAGSSAASAVAQFCTDVSKLASADAGASAGLAICALALQGTSAGILIFDDLFKFAVASDGSVTFNITVGATDSISFEGTPIGISIPSIPVSIPTWIGIPGTPIGINIPYIGIPGTPIGI